MFNSSTDEKYQVKTSECDITNPRQYFNTNLPDFIEMSCIYSSQDNSGPYTYNWDGMNKRTKTNWFGGSNAMIKLIKGFGFFLI